jgi:VWFA-related protein
MTRFRIALLLAAVLVATAAAADDASINSAPRSLDVVVTDIRGNHIPGLTQADFQILEDGKSRDIARFASLARGTGGDDLQPPRNVLLLLDETSISLAARRTLVASLKQFVETRVRPIDRVMVVTVAGVGGVFPATSWTSNKADLMAALDKAEQASLSNKGYERREAERQIQMTIDFAMQAAQSGRPSLVTFDSIMSVGRQYAGSMQQEARAVAGAFNDALSFLGSGPGKKIAVVAGGGLSTRPGSDLFQYVDNVRQRALSGQYGREVANGAATANPMAESSRFEITDYVRDMAKSARDRGVVVYAIDPDVTGSGMLAAERTSAVDNSEEFMGIADRLSGYQLLSSFTGGLTLTGRGEMPVAALSSDLDTHYVLSYTQTLNAKGMLPKTEVRVTKPGMRTRFGYTGGPETAEATLQDTVLANQAVGAVWTNDLQIALAKDQPTPDAEGRRVKLHVLIPVKSLKLIQEGTEMTGGFAVYVSTGDDRGNASPINRQSHVVRWPTEKVPDLMDKTIGFNVEVVMKPGRNQISVGVLDQRSQQTGFAKTIF